MNKTRKTNTSRSRASLQSWAVRRMEETGEPYIVNLCACYRKAIERAARASEPYTKMWMAIQLHEDLEADWFKFDTGTANELHFAICNLRADALEDIEKTAREDF